MLDIPAGDSEQEARICGQVAAGGIELTRRIWHSKIRRVDPENLEPRSSQSLHNEDRR